MVRRLIASLLACALILPASCGTAGLADAYMALDGEGNRKRTVFFTDTNEIFCVAEFASGRPDVTVTATVRQVARYDYAQRRFVDADIVQSVEEIAPGKTTKTKLSFQLRKLDPTTQQPSEGSPFPAGSFACELRVDGELERALTFNIDFPECPEASLASGSQCLGFYPAGQVCRASGKSSGDPRSCTCDEAKGAWVCGP